MSLQLNLHNRLSLVLWGAALLAFMLTGVGLALYQSLTLEQRARQIMEPYAQLVAVGADAAVTFEDPQRAQEVLDTLRANPQILGADIFLESGQILASFKPTANMRPQSLPDKPDGIYLNRNTAELLQGLPRGARLRLSMGLEQLSQQTRELLWLFGAGVLVLLIATLSQLAVLRRTIARPIASLTDATERVRTLGDYEHRVPASGSDEVARLGQSFNAMLETVQQRENELRRSTLFQRAILDNVAYGIISATPDGVITSFNPAAEDLLGYTAGELIGKQMPALWHDPEEMAQRARQLTDELGKIITPGFEVFSARAQVNRPEENEWTFIRKDGTRITVLLSITALRDQSSRITGFVGLAYDLTERKKSERQLALLSCALNIVDEAVFLIGENAHFSYVNDQCSRKLGYTRPELLGMSVSDIDPNFPVERWRKYWNRLLVENSLTFETCHRTKDGQLFPVEINVSYFEYDGRKYNLAFARDITQRKQADLERLTTLHFFESMDRINRAIQGAKDLEGMMSDTLDAVLSIFKCDRVYLLFPCDPESLSWSIPMERSRPEYPGFLAQKNDMPISPETANIFSLLLEVDHPVRFDPESQYAMPETIKKLGGFQSGIAMALRPKLGKSWEFGLQQCSDARVWTQAEERLFQEIGRRLTDALTGLLSHRDLQESEEKYRTLIQKIQAAVIVHGADTQILTSNTMAQQLLGLTEDQLLAKTTIDPDWHFFRDDGTDAPFDEYPVNQVLTSHKPLRNLILGIHRPLKKDVWVLVNADPVFNDADAISQVIVTFIDITEYRQIQLRLYASEREFRTLAENSPDVIVRYDRQGRRIYVNPEFERVNHLTAQQVLGKTPDELSTELKPWAKMFTENLMEAMASGSVVKLDFSWTDDGKQSCWFVRIVPEFNEDGKVMSALSIWSDITQRKQVEEELRQHKDQLEDTIQQRTAELLLARDAAEAANKAKSVFLANMSHELRTPLNAILGFSSMMRRDPQLTASQSENLHIINRSGEHLLNLINDVLEMAKIEAGRLQLDIAPFDLGSLVQDVTEMMQIRAQEKGLWLQLEQPAEFPRYIKSDEARIRQILINLINNAVKFTEQGGITLRLKGQTNARYHLLIEVEDSGAGIAPKDQTRLFEPFVQLTEGSTQHGTGLGLAITRQFVKLMGGSIGVESAQGQGSLFRIDLPVELAEADDILQPKTLEPAEVAGLVPGQPRYKIMIVEDQHENQLLLSKLMIDLSLEVKVAENGQQCLELFQNWQPDLIWMDRQMPIMDGIETSKRIRQLGTGQTVKIVAVTASAFKEQQQEMLDAGIDDFVRKPYRFKEIYDCMARQLDIKFIYLPSSPTAETTAVSLSADMLSVLPKAFRQKLRHVLISLDTAQISETIRQIADIDAQLALALSQLAEYFDYPAILKCLDEIKDR